MNNNARMIVMMMDDIFGFLYVNAMNKSVFVFSDLKWMNVKDA